MPDAAAPISVETLLLQHPELHQDPEAVVDLIYQEVLLRKEKGQPPTLPALLARFPQYEAALRDQLELDELLESPSLKAPTVNTEPPVAEPAPGADTSL